MTELVTQPCIRPVDTQCFTDDALGRLTEAWTAKTDCSSKPSASTVGGPDAYWQTFKYDPVGNRTQQTDHGTGALAGADATTTYAHNNPNTGLPHAVQTAAVTGGPQGGQKSTFKYDAAGNTTKRTIGATTQDLKLGRRRAPCHSHRGRQDHQLSVRRRRQPPDHHGRRRHPDPHPSR